MIVQQTKQWIKTSESPLAQSLYKILKTLRCGDVPHSQWLYYPLLPAYQLLNNGIGFISRVLVWTPLFKTQVKSMGKNLYLYGGMPFISGSLNIQYGDNCRISGKTTFAGRSSASTTPQLNIGNNVDIGWMSTLTVATKIDIGNNVRIAAHAFIAGFPGHPINAIDRAKGLPETEDQVSDIVIKDDVWIATGVSIMQGVTIGERSIIAAGSVVTKDIPADVLAGGVPAQVIKSIKEHQS